MVTFDADLIPASSSTTGAARNTPSCFRIQPTIRLTKRRQSAGRAASASLILRHARQHGLAVARGELDQRVEIGLLAFEPAAEGADGCADLGALRLTTDVRLSGGSAIGYAKDG
jgi:hypothetical protein